MTDDIGPFDPGPFYDDHLIATIVSECLNVMRDYPTRTKLTACYNLTERVLSVFTILSDKEDILRLLDEFHAELKKEVEKMYE